MSWMKEVSHSPSFSGPEYPEFAKIRQAVNIPVDPHHPYRWSLFGTARRIIYSAIVDEYGRWGTGSQYLKSVTKKDRKQWGTIPEAPANGLEARRILGKILAEIRAGIIPAQEDDEFDYEKRSAAFLITEAMIWTPPGCFRGWMQSREYYSGHDAIRSWRGWLEHARDHMEVGYWEEFLQISGFDPTLPPTEVREVEPDRWYLYDIAAQQRYGLSDRHCSIGLNKATEEEARAFFPGEWRLGKSHDGVPASEAPIVFLPRYYEKEPWYG